MSLESSLLLNISFINPPYHIYNYYHQLLGLSTVYTLSNRSIILLLSGFLCAVLDFSHRFYTWKLENTHIVLLNERSMQHYWVCFALQQVIS